MRRYISKVIKKATQKYYDVLTKDYDNLYHDYVSQGEDKIVKGLAESFLKHSSAPNNILDLGCGTGLGYEMLSPEKYVGVDISSNMVKRAKRLHPGVTFLNEDFDTMKYESNSYDNVISFYGSLSHSVNLRRVALGIKKSLKPGGKFVLMFYSRYSFKNITQALFKLNLSFLGKLRPYKIRNYGKEKPKPVPAYFYSVGTLKEYFKDFEDVKCYGLTYLPEVPLVKNLFKMNDDFTESFLEVEFNTIGKWFPNLGYSLIVTGEKPVKNES